MADSIVTIPATITSVDTSEHEVVIPAYLVGDHVYTIEVLTGSIQISADRSITGGSTVLNQASNNKLIVTINGSLFYKATTSGDNFSISR